jgi:pimeloyl-ACP methyl ester carboxylesterase
MTEPPQLDGVRHSYVDAGGLRVHVAEAGPPDGDPILMLHGWPQHFYEWRHVIPLLPADRRLICPDLRGFGWTEVPDGPIDAETFAADAVALLDAMGIERVDLIGHDWGGYAGFLLCLRHPERVRRFVALGTPHPFNRVTRQIALGSWRAWYTLPLAAGIVRYKPEVVGRFLARERIPEHDVEVFVERLREPARADATARLYRAYQRSLVGVVGGGYRAFRLQTPTRLLFGERDQAVPRAALEGFGAYADDMELELVPGGHFIADRRPELVAARAKSFLAV